MRLELTGTALSLLAINFMLNATEASYGSIRVRDQSRFGLILIEISGIQAAVQKIRLIRSGKILLEVGRF
jgi:hypothetical protein